VLCREPPQDPVLAIVITPTATCATFVTPFDMIN
jgi:hypothetical protein